MHGQPMQCQTLLEATHQGPAAQDLPMKQDHHLVHHAKPRLREHLQEHLLEYVQEHPLNHDPKRMPMKNKIQPAQRKNLHLPTSIS